MEDSLAVEQTLYPVKSSGVENSSSGDNCVTSNFSHVIRAARAYKDRLVLDLGGARGRHMDHGPWEGRREGVPDRVQQAPGA
eukprot:8669810-Heterocapsa_arctica.AAC.1